VLLLLKIIWDAKLKKRAVFGLNSNASNANDFPGIRPSGG
jgi:hypothetical protein